MKASPDSARVKRLPVRRSSTMVLTAVVVLIAMSGTACHSPSSESQGAVTRPRDSSPGESLWIAADGLELKTKVYKSANLSDHPVLIVVLHGDLLEPRVAPSYHYLFARRVAEQMHNVVVAAVLRPGYTDEAGDRSEGNKGLATGDNYTPETVDSIAQVVHALKAKYHPAAAVIMGHSGGAAIAGDMLGLLPSELSAALLVSCPCNLSPWRRYMARTQFTKIGPSSLLFLLPVKSLSPIDLAAEVPRTIPVRMVVGGKDPVTPPRFTQEYAGALRNHGVPVSVTVAPGLKHNILLEPVVTQQLAALVGTVEKPSQP